MAASELFIKYLENQTRFIHLMTGDPEDTIRPIVKAQIEQRVTSQQITNVLSTSPGHTITQTEDLWAFIKRSKGNVMVPSGSTFISTDKKLSMLGQMLVDKLKARKICKKKMLAAEAVGDDVTARRENWKQASIKINCNSAPGGFGSPYNLLYDKGCYNAITSMARSLIAHAYTVTEQLIGGNFVWYTEQELVNHIIINTLHAPPIGTVNRCVSRHKLMVPTRQMLFDFYLETIHRAVLHEPLATVRVMLDHLSDEEVTFLYYLGNLRHLIWNNESIFRPWFDKVFDTENCRFSQTQPKPEELFNIEGDLLTLLTVMMSKKLAGKQVYELPKSDPNAAIGFINIANSLAADIADINDLFETFILYKAEIPDIDTKPLMMRNTVILSDTDSVMFTTKDWAVWYTGTDLITDKSYEISSIIIYWLTKAVAHVLEKFSIQTGAVGTNVKIMQMKNEWTYTVFLTYDLKKHYVALGSIKEGVILPKLFEDVKGANLRKSSIGAASTKFIREFICTDVLEVAQFDQLNAVSLITKVVNFEQRILKSMRAGEIEFLQMTSIREESNYKKPLSTAYFYHLAWNNIFGETYGDIQVPTKAPIVRVHKPTTDYLNYLRETSPNIHAKMTNFINQYGKFPSSFALNPIGSVIPKELQPIVDVRSIVHDNLKPCYLTLTRLGVSVGLDSKDMLLSDMYKYLVE